MAIEFLNNAASFAHHDGALVYPLTVDEHHVLVTESGATLLLPTGLRVEYAGRFGIDAATGDPYVNTRLTGEETYKVARWAEQLQSDEVQQAVRARIAEALAAAPNPAGYTHTQKEDI